MVLRRRNFLISAVALAVATGLAQPAFPLIQLGGSAVAQASGYYADPYSTYTTYWVDPLNGNDANPGTSQASAKQTLAAGVALLTVGGSRLIVLPTAVLNVSSNLTFPAATGTSASARIVVQGLPSASTSPQVVLAQNVEWIVNMNAARDYVVLRKLNVSGSGTQASPGTGAVGLIRWYPDYPCQSPLVQYCELHNQVSQDITAGIRIEGAHVGAEFSYNKIHDLANTANTRNGCGIISYKTASVWVHHNEIYNCSALIYDKQCAATSPNGWTIEHNSLHNWSDTAVLHSEAGSSDPNGFSGPIVQYNLFYGGAGASNFACGQENQENLAQSTNFTLRWNTFAEDTPYAILFRAMTAITVHSNVIMATNEKVELDDAYSPRGWTNSITQWDYNAYLTGSGDQWWLGRYPASGQPAAYEATSLAQWQTAFSVGGRYELTANPDTHATSFTSVATNFPNYASRDYTLASGSPLKGTGLGGSDPGYNPSDIGPGW